MQDHEFYTTPAPRRRRRRPRLWLVLLAICASPALIALAVGLTAMRVLVFLLLLPLLAQLYGFMWQLFLLALGQLFTPAGILALATGAFLYWLLRHPSDPPGQPKG